MHFVYIIIICSTYVHIDTEAIEHMQVEEPEFEDVVEEYEEKVFPKATPKPHMTLILTLKPTKASPCA